jgi:hypothetical protein
MKGSGDGDWTRIREGGVTGRGELSSGIGEGEPARERGGSDNSRRNNVGNGTKFG